MYTIILRNGLLASIVLLVGASVPFLLGGYERFSYPVMGYITYAVIFAALFFVVFGIRQYKHLEGGHIRMNDGLKVGMLMVLFPAIAFFIYTALFMAYNSDHVIAAAMGYQQSVLTAAEFKEYQQALNSQRAAAESPWLQGGLMFVTVFALGFIVAALAALWQSRTAARH